MIYINHITASAFHLYVSKPALHQMNCDNHITDCIETAPINGSIKALY